MISVETPFVVYAGNGVRTDFNFNWTMRRPSATSEWPISVWEQTLDPGPPIVLSPLLLDYSDFIVLGPDGSESNALEIESGTIRIEYGKEPADGTQVLIRRTTPLDQLLFLEEFKPFSADAMENELDKLTMICQDLKSAEIINIQLKMDAVNEAAAAEYWATQAEGFAGEAEGYRDDAEGAADRAKVSEDNANTSETNSNTSETNAALSAAEAVISASDADGFASDAAISAGEASDFADNAADSATEAEATLVEFQDEYWGRVDWNPGIPGLIAQPHTGAPVQVGDMFWNIYDDQMYVCSTVVITDLVVTGATWVPTGTTGVTKIIAGTSVEISPLTGVGNVTVKATSTGNVDEVVVGKFEGTLTYNGEIPKVNDNGDEIVYKNGDYFIFSGPSGIRTEQPLNSPADKPVDPGDYCVCTTGTKGPADDYSILEEQIQINTQEIFYNDVDIAEIEGTNTIGSTVILVDGGRF